MAASIRLGPFELREPIGKGGMGRVWAGVYVPRGVPVAVKVVTAERAQASQYREAFRNEVQAMARLEHPGIVTVLDYGDIPPDASDAGLELVAGSPYLVMERITRGSLQAVGVIADWLTLQTVLLQLLDALAHAHARGVIHRDLKPDNVLVAGESPDDLRLKLTDFGIAHATGVPSSEGPQPSSTLGTPAYMAPEQIRGESGEQGPWTDIYALGCLAYRFITGHPPFRGRDRVEILHGHLYGRVPALPDRDDLPRAFPRWLARTLAKRPVERFQRAADAAFALGRIGTPPLGAARAGTHRTMLRVPDLFESDTVPITRGPAIEPHTSHPSDVQPTSDATATLPPYEHRETIPALPTDDSLGETVPPLPETWRRSESRLPMALVGAGLGLYGLRPIPFVARERERDVIWDELRRVRGDGKGRAVVLRGAAGNGKSRLAQWITHRAHEVGAATILHATHSPISNAADGLARMVATALGCTGMSQIAIYRRVRRAWRERVGAAIDGYTARALAEVMRPLNAGTDAQGAPALEFASNNERYAVVYSLLALLCRERLVILWLEDVQWSTDTLGFARYVLFRQASRPLPVLLLLTVREEALVAGSLARRELADVIACDASREIHIGPLGEHEHRVLIQQLIRIDSNLAEEVRLRTAGNPLFAVQLVNDWVERGVLRAGDDGFTLAPGEAALIPDDIHLLWATRVATIVALFSGQQAHDARRCLEIAATLGQDVNPIEWRRACALAGVPVPDRLIEHMTALRLAHLGPGWSFAHGMLRESIERSAAEAGRTRDNQRVCARMLATLYDADHPGIAERQAQHLVSAGDLDDALEPMLRAVRQRIESGDFHIAEQLADQRELLLSQLAVAESDLRWTEGWMWRSRICIKRGSLAEGERLIDRARRAAEDAGWTDTLAEVHWLGSLLANKRGDIEGGVASCSRALELYRAIDHAEGIAHVHYELGELRKLEGDLTGSVQNYEAAIAQFEHSGNLARAGAAQAGLSDTYRRMGQLDRALELNALATSHLRQVGNMHDVAVALNDRGDIYRYRGDLGQAAEYYRQAVEFFAAQGSGDTAITHTNLAIVLIERGDYADAEDMLRIARADFEAQSRTGYLSFVYALLLPCLAASGDWPAWDRHHALAVEHLARSQLVDEDLARPLTLTGDLCRDRGEPERARAAYLLAASQWRALGRDDLALDVTARV